MERFNRNIINIIKKFSYPFFVIQQDKNVKCSCVNYDTKEADPGCKKCLGLGYKIKIKKIKGACQESDIPSTTRPSNEILISKEYYIDCKYPVFDDNVIVDGEQVLFIYKSQAFRSFKGEKIYQKCSVQKKKFDSKVLLQNFHEIVGDNL